MQISRRPAEHFWQSSVGYTTSMWQFKWLFNITTYSVLLKRWQLYVFYYTKNLNTGILTETLIFFIDNNNSPCLFTILYFQYYSWFYITQFQTTPYTILISSYTLYQGGQWATPDKTVQAVYQFTFGINLISPSLGFHIHSLDQTSIPLYLNYWTTLQLTISQTRTRIKRKKNQTQHYFIPFLVSQFPFHMLLCYLPLLI